MITGLWCGGGMPAPHDVFRSRSNAPQSMGPQKRRARWMPGGRDGLALGAGVRAHRLVSSNRPTREDAACLDP